MRRPSPIEQILNALQATYNENDRPHHGAARLRTNFNRRQSRSRFCERQNAFDLIWSSRSFHRAPFSATSVRKSEAPSAIFAIILPLRIARFHPHENARRSPTLRPRQTIPTNLHRRSIRKPHRLTLQNRPPRKPAALPQNPAIAHRNAKHLRTTSRIRRHI